MAINADHERRSAHRLTRQKNLMIGGEALPSTLAGESADAQGGQLEKHVWPDRDNDLVHHPHHALKSSRAHRHTHRQHAGLCWMMLCSPCPSACRGALYIGGAGSQGYFQRDDLTAERLRPTHLLGRMYCTGDLARWRTDGYLISAGRFSGQTARLSRGAAKSKA
jgi:non-ribosomal peptide synthetase component F